MKRSPAASGAVMAPLIQQVIAVWGWRTAFMIMAGMIILVAVPVQFFFLRLPESAVVGGDRVGPAIKEGQTLTQSLATRAFWLALFALVVNAFALMAFRQHAVFILEERGLTAATAALATSALLLSSVAGQMMAGAFADRFATPRATLPFFCLPLLGFAVLFGAPPTTATILFAAVLLGLGSGGEYCLSPFFTGRYFGLRAFGQIQGVKLAVIALAAGLAPYLVGLWRDSGRTYEALAMLLGAVLLAGLVAAALLPPYSRTAPGRVPT
jgi:MFS family permease